MFVFFTYLDEWGALPRGGALPHVTVNMEYALALASDAIIKLYKCRSV